MAAAAEILAGDVEENGQVVTADLAVFPGALDGAERGVQALAVGGRLDLGERAVVQGDGTDAVEQGAQTGGNTLVDDVVRAGQRNPEGLGVGDGADRVFLGAEAVAGGRFEGSAAVCGFPAPASRGEDAGLFPVRVQSQGALGVFRRWPQRPGAVVPRHHRAAPLFLCGDLRLPLWFFTGRGERDHVHLPGNSARQSVLSRRGVVLPGESGPLQSGDRARVAGAQSGDFLTAPVPVRLPGGCARCALPGEHLRGVAGPGEFVAGLL